MNLLPQKLFLDYVMSRVSGDQRPYLEISVLGYPIIGLLDTGASRTSVGPSGYAILQRLGLKLQLLSIEYTMANGQTSYNLGCISTPLCLENKIKVIDILLIPDLPHTLILGVDFWTAMDIIPDPRQNIWHFSAEAPIIAIVSPVLLLLLACRRKP
ncbi:hypothetical protein ILUMI_26910 [Ignelater luminosus]|uniref:Peptidase A2 domain-containing protein n=1 Tax=Ignelater luminosus TaxID=2038154 RepID=A0A8K0C3Z8_IGNLU|nr:hypothetical protein ILUMI_26910 [Ignelater luminosus]